MHLFPYESHDPVFTEVMMYKCEEEKKTNMFTYNFGKMPLN